MKPDTQTTKIYTCPICGREYTSFSGLWRHKKKHPSLTRAINSANPNMQVLDISPVPHRMRKPCRECPLLPYCLDRRLFAANDCDER